MALVGYPNKLTADVYTKLLTDDVIAKLLFYIDKKYNDIDIEDLPKVKNPVGKLKTKVFKNRRVDKLLRESDCSMFVNYYGCEKERGYGKSTDNTIKNVVQIGIFSHNDIDNTASGSRALALSSQVRRVLSGWNIDGLGKIHFNNMQIARDVDVEYLGYLMYFEIYSIKEGI